MKVNGEVFYHIHRNGIRDTEWIQGNSIRFDSTIENEYLKYYNEASFDLVFDNRSIKPMNFFENFILTNDYKTSININISKQHFEKFFQGYKESRCHIRELIFEDVRRKHYSSLPSRYNCVWLCSEKEVNDWLNTFNQPCEVFKVKVYGEIHMAEASLLIADFMGASEIMKLAHRYWSGKSTSIKSKEILFIGDLYIQEKVLLQQFNK